jgi:hypothetical protein
MDGLEPDQSRGTDVEAAGRMMMSADGHSPAGLNIGDLDCRGMPLTTREVLAVIHEACRKPGYFPQSPDDLWVADTGEVLVASPDHPAGVIDPRIGAAALLERMLPPDTTTSAEYAVSASLRGLPSRLRATHGASGPQDRGDLMAILRWHLDADPRDVIQQLVRRVNRPAPAAPPEAAMGGEVEDEWELFPETQRPPSPPPAAAAPPGVPRQRTGASRNLVTVLGIVLLAMGIGAAAAWWRNDANPATEPSPQREARADREPALPASAPAAPAAAPSTPRVVPALSALRLEVPGGAFSPAYSAEGRELVFHAGRQASGRLLVASLGDRGQVTGVEPLIEDRARNYHPRVSPDGRWIAFDSDRDGVRGVYVMERGNTSAERVSGSGYAAVPTWSPDMKWLAFVRAEPSRPRVWNLWLRDVATGALRRHTEFRSGQVWGASWFPDGRSFAYSHDDRLIISHLDGRDDIIVRSPRRGTLVRTPAVSPDGTTVVFQVFGDGVWLVDVATREMRRLLDDRSAEEFAWSPDGRRIAYHSRQGGAWVIRDVQFRPA